MHSVDVDDTIAAIASASGAGLRGIIRLSGPDCLKCLRSTFEISGAWSHRSLKTATAIDAQLKIADELLLPGQLLVWPTHRSYTRQPAAEFHTFGSEPLLKMALSKICQAGVRLANPGEFTLRAFLSGRLDLIQAEAVLATINAHVPTQLTGALNQLAGGLSGPIASARDQLLFLLAELEAGLDFVEEDIEFISSSELTARLGEVEGRLKQIIEQIVSRDLTAEQIRVVLIGLPNAGKSSLFNALLSGERAIVTEQSGTTTDFLIGEIDLDGLKIELVDTAGIELDASQQPIATQAQQQREFAESNSQIQLLCIDGTRDLNDWEKLQLQHLPASSIVVQTKSDLVVDNGPGTDDCPIISHPRRLRGDQATVITTSSTRSTGLNDLRSAIREQAMNLLSTDKEIVGATVARTADSLRAAGDSVQRAYEAARLQAGEEIVAAEIRAALDDLGRVAGTVYTDDILDVVFSRFCIGK